VSIHLQEFSHWTFLINYRLLTNYANLRVASTSVRLQPCILVQKGVRLGTPFLPHYTPALILNITCTLYRRTDGGVTRSLIQGRVKLSWRWPAKNQSEKFKKWEWIRMLQMSILAKKTKTPRKTWKNNDPLKLQKTLNIKM